MADSDDDLFGPTTTTTTKPKPKKKKKKENDMSLLDEMMAEDKERQARVAELKEQTDKVKARTAALLGDEGKTDSPLVIDWDFINGGKKRKTPEIEETESAKKKKKRKKKGLYAGVPFATDDDDADEKDDGPDISNDDVFGVKLPAKLCEPRCIAIVKDVRGDDPVGQAFQKVVDSEDVTDLLEAFSYVPAMPQQHAGIVRYLHRTAALDPRPTISNAAKTTLQKVPDLHIDPGDMVKIFDLHLIKKQKKKESSQKTDDDMAATIERLAG